MKKKKTIWILIFLIGIVTIGILYQDNQMREKKVSTSLAKETIAFADDLENGILIANNNIKRINFCAQPNILKAFKIGGYALFVVKICVPILLMGLAVWDLFRAMISSDEKANKEAMNKLIRRVIISIVIFLIPTVLNYALLLVDGADDTADRFTKCTSCLLDPGNCNTGS